MKILIRLPNWLGDVVMSTAFINAVLTAYPDAVVDIILKKELSSLAPLINGARNIYPFSKQENRGLTGAYRFGKKLRTENYDLFFNLPESVSSQLLARATAAKHRIGFAKEAGFLLLNHCYRKPGNMHRVEEYLSLLEQFNTKTVGHIETRLSLPLVKRKPRQLLLNFNSEAESRRMPAEKAIAIVRHLQSVFKDTDLIFIGSSKESAFIQQILNGLTSNQNITDMAGKTNLPDLARLMAESTVLLTTDSGPAHLANSLSTPVVALFGAGNEHNTAPYNQSNLTVLRNGALPCEPCVKNTCKLYGIPKCMTMLDEMRIIEALRVYLPHA